ncbi:MAG: hypothetical protein ABEH64_12035, partial [Salinirussus sp.]
EKEYPIELLIRYDDPDGTTHISAPNRLPVQVRAPPESTGGGLPVVPIIIVVLGLKIAIVLVAKRFRV